MTSLRGARVGAAVVLLAMATTGAAAATAAFTPLVELPAPKIVASAAEFPDKNFPAANIIDGVADGRPKSEYATDSKGTETFIDFDFGQPTEIAAFRHIDRHDPATVKAAELVFGDQADFGQVVATVKVEHVNKPGGTTFVSFPAATARYVRWKVTAIESYATVGGAEITFFSKGQAEATPARTKIDAAFLPALLRQEGRPLAPVRLSVSYPYVEPVEAAVQIADGQPLKLDLRTGSQSVETSVPAVEKETTVKLALLVAGQPVVQQDLQLRPVRRWEVHLLPHSHVDIGYTHVQTEVEKRQWQYLEQALDIIRRTADYPPEARFKWNSEVLWAVDSYLKQAPEQKRNELIEAVRKGQIHLDGLYGNELTALCRPEELLRLTDCARRLARQYSITIDSAMISDVPGYTWGIVPAMALSGIKYFSIGPNPGHRIGYTLEAWGDKPFYWLSPCGTERVLCWMGGKGYAWFHSGDISKTDPQRLFEYLNQLVAAEYPYDMVQLRYTVGGDNGPPDPKLPDFVKDWNAKYEYPKLIITTTSEMMRQFERRYGDKLPKVSGDFTPYWEDGAGSSAKETAFNREAAEQLVVDEALWALLNPKQYPDDEFSAAWRNVILYDEHTWGAHCSITQPDSEFTLAQWKIKGEFAWAASREADKLFHKATPPRKGEKPTTLQVFNTLSWPRTGLVSVPGSMAKIGDRVVGPDGNPVPSQRLVDGQLVFLAADVPPLGAKRFKIEPGPANSAGSAKVEGNKVSNSALCLTIDEKSGAISGLSARGIAADLVNQNAGVGLNDYIYVAGRDPKDRQRPAGAEIKVLNRGPLVASLQVTSAAPGCNQLTRAIWLDDASGEARLVNLVDKRQVRTPEGVYFGFAFNVPDGVMRMDIPWAVVRPEADQMPGACKNYFTVQRWIDVSNDSFGVTWATVDAPLVEVGAIRTDVVPSPFEAQNWVKHIEPTQTFYSYVMNNYWETNYKASQEGPTAFLYALRPHAGGYDGLAASRFGIEQRQPLVAVPSGDDAPAVTPSRLRIEPNEVIVTSLKPSADRKALIVRLFGAAGRPVTATLAWSDPQPKTVCLSNLAEESLTPLAGPVEVPAFGVVTIRAELAD